METNKDFSTRLEAYADVGRPGRDERFAQWVSLIGSPPLLVTTLIFLCAGAVATPSAWGWAMFEVLVSVAAPLGYVAWLLRRGQISDFDVSIRQERLRPFLMAIASAVSAWLILFLGGAPSLLIIVTSAAMIQAVLMLSITLRWKISVHCAAASGLAVAAVALLGQAAAPFVLSVPLIAWSRVKLGRHDLPQTIGGTIMGSLTMLAAFYLV